MKTFLEALDLNIAHYYREPFDKRVHDYTKEMMLYLKLVLNDLDILDQKDIDEGIAIVQKMTFSLKRDEMVRICLHQDYIDDINRLCGNK